MGVRNSRRSLDENSTGKKERSTDPAAVGLFKGCLAVATNAFEGKGPSSIVIAVKGRHAITAVSVMAELFNSGEKVRIKLVLSKEALTDLSRFATCVESAVRTSQSVRDLEHAARSFATALLRKLHRPEHDDPRRDHHVVRRGAAAELRCLTREAEEPVQDSPDPLPTSNATPLSSAANAKVGGPPRTSRRTTHPAHETVAAQ